MRKAKVLQVLVVAVAALACVGCAGKVAGPAKQEPPVKKGPILYELSDEEYVVYGALLEELFSKDTALTGDGNRIGGRGPLINQIVLVDRTIDLRFFQGDPEVADDDIPDNHDLLRAGEIQGGTKDLADSFRQANRRPGRLVAQKIRTPRLEAFTIALDDYSRDQPPVPDAHLYARYPRCQGITILSRVGFSASGDLAVVVAGTMRAPLFGFGGVYLLKKQAGRWHIAESRMTWVS